MYNLTIRTRYATVTAPCCSGCTEAIAQESSVTVLSVQPSSAAECESCAQGWVA